MAGGMSEEADAENINLAYELKENVMLRIKAKEVVETSKSESVPVADKSPGRTSQNTVSSGQKTGSSLSKAAVDNSIKTGETKSQSAVAVNQKKSEEPYDKTLLGMDIIKDSGGVVVAEKEEQAKGNGKVNINTALLQDLDTLPGIGPSTAQKIITYREKNGGFKKIEDLMEVSGIGESKFNSLKDYIVTE
ncbi:MAG: ComEA family DNA-binding protein [Clostridiaceae bacterium]|nr:ComEA family DNA-binding protein [Clostridiaceae bacterium]